MKIKSIKISAFRGIPDILDLDLQGKSLLLLGENGTGKSSVIDAIEFFFTGKISHLTSRGPLALKDHGPNAKNPDNASVSLEFNPEGLITRSFDSSPYFPNSLNYDIKLAEKGQFILRRSQILNLINTTPADRYKFISQIIGDEKLEKVDTAIFQSRKYLADIVKKLEMKIDKINEEIFDMLTIEHSKDILKAINQLLKGENVETIDSLEKLKETNLKIYELTKSSDNESFANLNNIFSKIKEIPLILGKIDQEFHDAEECKEIIANSHNRSELSLIKILKNSLEIIKEDTDKCPLCGNKVESEILLKSINERLKSLESLKKTNERLKESIANIKDKILSLNENLEKLLSKMGYFEELNDYNGIINNKIESFNNFKMLINIHSFLQDDLSRKDFNDILNQLDKLLEDIKIESEGLVGAIKPSEKDKQLIDLYKFLSQIDEKIIQLNEDLEELKIAKNRLKISEILYKEFSDIKKRKIQEIYDTIKENVENYYKTLHPQESYENIKLGINPKKKGSTDLRMTIFGKEDEDPRALSSEGHLDSLGLCIFLALFKKAYEDFPLLVLDDVVTTMDSKHREKVCKLLFEEFGNKQFIITTHDNIWFDQLKAAQRVHNLSSKFKNYTIVKWDEYNGPDIEPYKVRWEKIQEKINAGDKYCAGNEGRRYLEWLLDDICNRTKAQIPANPEKRYTVNDLLGPARTRLNKLIKDDEYNEKIKKSFKNLDNTIIMGNLLSHNNLMAGNVSVNEVDRFCNSIHEIDELLRCSKCQTPLIYFKDLKVVRCKNTKCSNPSEYKTN